MATDTVSRRTALEFAALALLTAQTRLGFSSTAVAASVQGYGRDPDLLKRIVPWPRSLSDAQLLSLACLCEIILPADPPHPSAATIGVHQFLDEWVSAPYPEMRADRRVILDGLTALDDAMRKENGIHFSDATSSQRTALFDRFCSAQTTQLFSRRIIALVCAGYYTTREGHAAIGYVGNVVLGSFPGPPPEIIRHLEKSLEELPLPPANAST